MKIPPLGAQYFHEAGRTDGRTDITMLFVTIRNFANEPNDLKLFLERILTIIWYLFQVFLHLRM